MSALSKIFGGFSEGWKKLSSGRKIGIIVLSGGVLSALLFFIIFMGKPRYEPLFLNMPPEDMAKVVEKLKQDKVDYKPEGDTILVPGDKVEELRLSVISSGIMPSNGKGFELFDESRFGMTDTETRILYQRALETEIQRTIKAFDEIEYARVHLVLPEESVFARTPESARASVTLKFKNGKSLSPEQVRAVVSLVSGSVKNLPKENVEVIDSSFRLLSENIFNENLGLQVSVSDRYEIGRQFETKLSNDLKGILEAVFGPNKVRVSVNADLDFDSKEITSIKYDPEGILKSQHKISETITGGSGNFSGSPIDNNMPNSYPSGSTGGSTSTRDEETKNFNIGQTEEKIIRAPGQIKRLSTSVVLDGTLSEAVKASVRNIVASSVGYDQDRGDLITVEGIPFDDTLKKRVEADLKELEEQQKIAERNKKYIMYIGYPAAAIFGIILLIILISAIKSAAEKKSGGNLDVVISEPVAINEIINKQSILDMEESENNNLTGELKKYASKKPEQVVEIIKSWLAEDER